MKGSKLFEVLKEIGLSEHEAGVYLAALNLGPTSAIKIARASSVKRTTVYSVIDSLVQRGLMSIEIKGFKRRFAVASPEKLESMLEVRRERFKDLLPEFSALYNLKGEEGFIKYYEGLDSIKSVYETLLDEVKPGEDYLIISDQEQWIRLDKEYFHKFTERRAKLPINIRMLQVDTPTSREYKKYEKNYNYKMKFLPKSTSLTTNLIVIPKMVVIHQLIPPILAIVIENKSVIQMHREMFEIMWNSLDN